MPIKDMTYQDLVSHLTWELMKYVLKGELRTGVDVVIMGYQYWERYRDKSKT